MTNNEFSHPRGETVELSDLEVQRLTCGVRPCSFDPGNFKFLVYIFQFYILFGLVASAAILAVS